MLIFEWILVLLLGASLLTLLARRLSVPYPALLALGGAGLALLPFAPAFSLEPELALALFVAPVLLDSAYDASLRDLRRNWRPVSVLVGAAVGVSTLAVAGVAKLLVPSLPFAAAVALGAIVAPPDAAAAMAVLKQLRPPHRILVILEGESLLNDATALLIYRLAVGAVVTGGLSAAQVIPAFTLVVVGSAVAGLVMARVFLWLTAPVRDVPLSIILQFVGTFGIWLLAERLHLSGIITIVAFAISVARRAPDETPAKLRVPSYAVWETVVFVLNILAFVLIGLQVRPILGSLPPSARSHYLVVAAAVLGTVIVVRLLWVMLYQRVTANRAKEPLSVKHAFVVGWSGMRGVVTLAAAFALPNGGDGTAVFPFRDLILLCAFTVVVGTLVVQGLTLRPLLLYLGLRDDGPVERELRLARSAIAQAGMSALEGDASLEAETVRRELRAELAEEGSGPPPADLRRRVVVAQRQALSALRAQGEIGDDAFHRLVAHLDWTELSAGAEEVSA